MDDSHTGLISAGPPMLGDGPPGLDATDPTDQDDQASQFQGMGPILEDDDTSVFQETESMIRRQELMKINQWNIDEYFRCVVDYAYPWATLIHDTGKDTYSFELPYGVSSVSGQPIPNKNLDLVNEASEQLLVDFPAADAEPIDDSEDAQEAADLANRFLTLDGGEQGTNDAVLFDDRVKLALVTASTYIEVWTDPTGGGYVPLQIEAHPEAVSPETAKVGPDGMPTTDYVLRYVTAPQGGQFTDDPSKAAPQWQPKLMASKWQREHIRAYPENRPVDAADQLIVLGHCTLGEMKKRCPQVAQMAPEDLSALCDWVPPRFLVLLPPYQRARWKLSDGKTKNKMGSSDERIMFYYHRYIKACPDYPKGADVIMSGIDGGTVLDKRLLAVEVEVPSNGATSGRTKETRCREIPVVQITPRGDPYGQDPTGKCYVALFVGATEATAVLAQGYAEALNKVLHTPFVVPSTSPIEGWQVESARASGDMLQILRPEDKPTQLTPPVLPNSFFQMYGMMLDATDRIAHRTRATSGEEAPEKSGKAIQLAVSQNNIGNSSMLTAVNNSYARFCRIKLEVAMAEFTTPQQIAYVGEDGANKQLDFEATDFALIKKVTIKAGTGTGLSQDGKVQYMANLKAEGFIGADEAMESARPSFSKRLGIPDSPFEQYVSRAVDSWLDGPPELPPPQAPPQIDPATGQPVPPPTWESEYGAWKTAQDQYDQAQAQFQHASQAYTQYLTFEAQAAGGAPPNTLGPEQQNETAMRDYQTAVLQLQVMKANPQSGLQLDPMSGQAIPPQPPQPPQVPKPWVPFGTRPIDTLPQVSAIWLRRLARVAASVHYQKYGPLWQDVLDRKLTEVRQASAVASGAGNPTPPTQQSPQSPQAQQPTPATKPTQPQQSGPSPAAGGPK